MYYKFWVKRFYSPAVSLYYSHSNNVTNVAKSWAGKATQTQEEWFALLCFTEKSRSVQGGWKDACVDTELRKHVFFLNVGMKINVIFAIGN